MNAVLPVNLTALAKALSAHRVATQNLARYRLPAECVAIWVALMLARLTTANKKKLNVE
jgi:hypothetical protein